MSEIAKQIRVHKDGLEIIDEELMKKIRRKNLSASMISSFQQCPADWVMESFIIPQIEHIEPIYFARGHIFHETMEALYALPVGERTPKAINECVSNVIKKDYAQMMNDNETIDWIKQAIIGFLSLGIDYNSEEVAMIFKREDATEKELGVELFVKGKLGNTSRNIVGYVDLILDDGNGNLTIRDWKTGKNIAPFDPEKPINDKNDFGYWRQQLTYTMLMEQSGFNVVGAELIFPIAKGTVDIDVNNQKLREQVIKDYEQIDNLLNECIEENFFPFKGHFFCKWCGTLSGNFRTPRQKPQVNKRELAQLLEFVE